MYGRDSSNGVAFISKFFTLYRVNNAIKILRSLNVHPIIFECMVIVIHGWIFSMYVDEPIIAGKCPEQVP
jgi:hypothetical protein